jgi:hypothetical protein
MRRPQWDLRPYTAASPIRTIAIGEVNDDQDARTTSHNGAETVSAGTASERRGGPVVAERLIEEPYALVAEALHLRPAQLMGLAFPGTVAAGNGELDIQLAPHHLARYVRLPARITFRTPTTLDGHPAIELAWRARHLQRLFPVMNAGIRVHATAQGHSELVFDGNYRPPLGLAGVLGDVLVGHRVAQATAEAFLDDLAIAIGGDAKLRHGDDVDHVSVIQHQFRSSDDPKESPL